MHTFRLLIDLVVSDRLLAIAEALLITIIGLLDVTIAGNTSNRSASLAVGFISYLSLPVWVVAFGGLSVHLVHDYQRRWRLYRQVQTVAKATKALTVLRAFTVTGPHAILQLHVKSGSIFIRAPVSLNHR